MYESEQDRVARLVKSVRKMREAYLYSGYTVEEFDQALANVINEERDCE